MADYFVFCHTPDNADTDRRIQGLGFYGPPDASRPQWQNIDTIIGMIDAGAQFWVQVAGVQTLVVVRQHGGPFYRRYLTTLGDSFPPNNLLELPPCG